MSASFQDVQLMERARGAFKFFNAISDEEVREFLGFCENRQLVKGNVLWHAGDTDNYAAFIISGKVGIKRRTEFEDRYVIVGIFEQGSVVGELCLLTSNARSVTAEIMDPAELLILSSSNFEKLLSAYPMLGLKLLRHIFAIVSRRLRNTTDRIVSSIF